MGKGKKSVVEASPAEDPAAVDDPSADGAAPSEAGSDDTNGQNVKESKKERHEREKREKQEKKEEKKKGKTGGASADVEQAIPELEEPLTLEVSHPSRPAPDDEFLEFMAEPTQEQHVAARTIQKSYGDRTMAKQRQAAASMIQGLWANGKVDLNMYRRFGLYAFLFAVFAMFLAAASAAYGIWFLRIRAVPCEDTGPSACFEAGCGNRGCNAPRCMEGCELDKADSLAATNYIMLIMALFLGSLCVLAMVGAVRKNVRIMRFFSFALLVLMALEISILLVFTDAEKDVSMQFKKEALGVYAKEYCTYESTAQNAVAAVEDVSGLAISNATSIVDGCLIPPCDLLINVTTNSLCRCLEDGEEMESNADEDGEGGPKRSKCMVDWFDQNLASVVKMMIGLIILECCTSYFAWHILAKPQDFEEMVDGQITRARKKEKKMNDDSGESKVSEILDSFDMPPEAVEALRAENALITDTWYFEATVVFSVGLAMYVLAVDSPADPPQESSALLLRVIEIFVTVFLSLELTLELLTHIAGQGGLKKYLMNPWTQLDIVVLSVSWWYLYFPSRLVGVCRALRVLRPVRTIRIFESVQIVGRCIMDDITTLRDVILLMLMLLGGFALVGLTCFHGVLQYSCVKDCAIPCELGESVEFNDLWLNQMELEFEDGKAPPGFPVSGNGPEWNMIRYLATEKEDFPRTCTAALQANSSYFVGGVCGTYYQAGHRVDLIYEKSSRQRFALDVSEQERMGYEPENKLVVSCPATLKCAASGDDFVFKIYESGVLRAEYEEYGNLIETGPETEYPLRMKPKYASSSWYGREERSVAMNGENYDAEGVACVKLYGDPYARPDLGTPAAIDGVAPKGQKRFGYKGGAPRVLFPGEEDTGIRGFDNIGEAVLTMVIHLSGDNGMHIVPNGLADSDAIQGWLAWAYFAVSAIILSFVTLNLLLAVCCQAFSAVALIMRENEREKVEQARVNSLMPSSPTSNSLGGLMGSLMGRGTS